MAHSEIQKYCKCIIHKSNFLWRPFLTALSKEGKWVSEVQSSNASTSSKLWVQSLVSDGGVCSNVAGQSALAGISDVDTSSQSGGEGKTAGVAAQLRPQVDGRVDDIVVAHLNVGLYVGPELAGGGVNIDTELWRD